MGCLNADQGFKHWFGNIHLSGPCSRACYFCIGQHMMALDPLNTLGVWPLPGVEKFVAECQARGIRDIYITGSNTDPLLYEHTEELTRHLRESIAGVKIGIRTNGIAPRERRRSILRRYDNGSITVCSFDPVIYRAMMGRGDPPSLTEFLGDTGVCYSMFKVNVVLGPENVQSRDVLATLDEIARHTGIQRVNLREPYGQPHVGDPMKVWGMTPTMSRLGMPCYRYGDLVVTYWDVHYVEVESVNLYANGHVSVLYPISKGHDEATGRVLPQSEFSGGRTHEQWLAADVRGGA